MAGVFDGFATLAVVIGLGVALAHRGVLDANAQALLSRLAFFVASPALLVTVLESADLSQVFSRNLAATSAAVAMTAGLSPAGAHQLVAGSQRGRHRYVLQHVRAANLGIPIAAYVLGDASRVAPILLLQLLVLQPAGLLVVDASSAARTTRLTLLARTFSNPLLVASLIGVGLSATGIRLPTAIHAPLELIAGMAIPAMLLAYGVSLRLGPRPVSGAAKTEIWVIATLKLIAQPVAGYVLGRFVFGLEGIGLYAVTVLAALPTAQNMFVLASRYDRSVVVARDAVFVTTIGSVPAILAISALVV